MQESLNNQISNWYEGSNRTRVVRVLESIQDLIVVSLCIGLFSFMVIQLRAMFLSLLPPLDFRNVTSDILFLLILVELFRLLIIYLQEQRVSIGVAVEVSIVSVLREVIVRGVLETSWVQILAACAFLMVLGALLVIRVWMPPTFSGIDPERRLLMRNKLLSADESSTLDRNSTILNFNGNASLFAETNGHLGRTSKLPTNVEAVMNNGTAFSSTIPTAMNSLSERHLI